MNQVIRYDFYSDPTVEHYSDMEISEDGKYMEHERHLEILDTEQTTSMAIINQLKDQVDELTEALGASNTARAANIREIQKLRAKLEETNNV